MMAILSAAAGWLILGAIIAAAMFIVNEACGR